MQIRIDNLSVNGLGPIASKKWQFTDINLIYGRNEQGKTFIVEYLLSSLFKNSPKTRPLTDSGQVNVIGLADTWVRFEPKSRKKIEDYLFADDKPVDLSRLLVVKAGETKFPSSSEKGITKTILKDYLSDQRVLDMISSKIPTNIQKSTWENGQLILGSQSGECRTYSNYLYDLEKAEKLLAEVDAKYTLGDIVKEKSELEQVDRLIQEQENARRYCAYQKFSKKKVLFDELEQLPQDKLDEIKKINSDIQSLQKQIQKDEDQINDLEPQCTHFEWLETAIAECEKRPEALGTRSDMVYILPGIIFILAAIVFAFLQISWGALVSGALAALVFVLTILHYRSRLQKSDETAEINRVFQAYEERFGQKALSITDLKSKHSELKPKYYGLDQIKADLKACQKEFAGLQKELDAKLSVFFKQIPKLENVDAQISDLQNKRKALDEDYQRENVALAALGVEPEDYLSDPVDMQFDQKLFNRLISQRDELCDSIEEKEQSLQVLKQRVCDLTGSSISSPWDVIIDQLRDHRDDVSHLMKESKGKIGSGLVITQVINEIREREDEGIAKALASNAIREPIKALTQAYQGVEMEGDDIYVFSEYERFPVHHLSTGAQEQILLALRIGLASYYLKDLQMFLILDDAFQHSDWQRREWMVDQMADLASIGWQIIYFAMDDHIKQLFEERVKPKFKDRYAAFELTN